MRPAVMFCAVLFASSSVIGPVAPVGAVTSPETSERASAMPRCTLTGTPGDDVLVGTSRRDVICGGAGDDLILGLGGDDILFGGTGQNTLRGGRGEDFLIGGTGVDRLFGGFGDDRLFGAGGVDVLDGEQGADRGIQDPPTRLTAVDLRTVYDLPVGTKVSFVHDRSQDKCISDAASFTDVVTRTGRLRNHEMFELPFDRPWEACFYEKLQASWDIRTVDRRGGQRSVRIRISVLLASPFVERVDVACHEEPEMDCSVTRGAAGREILTLTSTGPAVTGDTPSPETPTATHSPGSASTQEPSHKPTPKPSTTAKPTIAPSPSPPPPPSPMPTETASSPAPSSPAPSSPAPSSPAPSSPAPSSPAPSSLAALPSPTPSTPAAEDQSSGSPLWPWLLLIGLLLAAGAGVWAWRAGVFTGAGSGGAVAAEPPTVVSPAAAGALAWTDLSAADRAAFEQAARDLGMDGPE